MCNIFCTLITFIVEETFKAMSYLQCSTESHVGKKGYVLILNDRRFQKKTSFIISVFPTQRLYRTSLKNITQQTKPSDVKCG